MLREWIEKHIDNPDRAQTKKRAIFYGASLEILERQRGYNLLAVAKMETQVLIPQEFSLVLTAPGGKKSREQVATVFSSARIPQGTVLYPYQGTVRTDKLEIFSYTMNTT